MINFLRSILSIFRDRKLANLAAAQASVDKLRSEIKDIEEKGKIAANKAAAEVQKTLAEAKKTELEYHKTLTAIALGLASAIGAVGVIVYCLYYVGGFPAGLTTGDTMFFLFAAVAIGIAGLLYSGLGMLSFIPLHFRKTDITDETYTTIYCIVAGFIAAVCVSQIDCAISAISSYSAPFDFLKDSLVFMWAVIILMTIIPLVVMGVIGAKCVTLESQQSSENRQKNFWRLTLGMVPAAIYGAILIHVTQDITSLGAALAGGFCLTLAIQCLDKDPQSISGDSKPSKGYGFGVFFLCLAITIPYITAGAVGDKLFKNAVMDKLGVYKERAAVIVNSENLDTLKAASSALGIPLFACKSSPTQAVVTNVRVLWHGPGSTSVIDLSANVGTHSTKIQLKSEGVKLVSGDPIVCMELTEGMFFESNQSTPISDAIPAVQEAVGKLMALKKEDGSVVVSGHADPMIRRQGSNDQLALERACEVAGLIRKTGARSVWIRNFGSRSPIKECSADDLSQVALRECNAVNRRVEVRLINTAVEPMGAFDSETVCKDKKGRQDLERKLKKA